MTEMSVSGILLRPKFQDEEQKIVEYVKLFPDEYDQ